MESGSATDGPLTHPLGASAVTQKADYVRAPGAVVTVECREETYAPRMQRPVGCRQIRQTLPCGGLVDSPLMQGVAACTQSARGQRAETCDVALLGAHQRRQDSAVNGGLQILWSQGLPRFSWVPA